MDVVASRREARPPPVHHRREEFVQGGLREEVVQRLRLGDEWPAGRRMRGKQRLVDLARRQVTCAHPRRQIERLNAAPGSDELVAQGFGPEARPFQLLHQVRVQEHELARERLPGVEVRRERLERLVLSNDLRARRRRH